VGDVVGVPGNGIGEEGAKALGPHLAKLNNLTTLEISGACVAQRFHVCYFFGGVWSGYVCKDTVVCPRTVGNISLSLHANRKWHVAVARGASGALHTTRRPGHCIV